MDWSIDIGMQKMMRYCAYQDRSRWELEQKLRALECPANKWDEVIAQLEEEGFWDEARFARSYVRGKFRQKSWGKDKIRQGLWAKGVRGELADTALGEIDPEEYLDTLRAILERKLPEGSPKPDAVSRQKIFQSLRQKGFGTDVIRTVLDERGI